jgi:glycogen debranching enzyme
MKHWIAIVSVLCASAAAAPLRPPVDTFFARMEIAARPGTAQRFVAGDNVAGYYEGYTHGDPRGAGYRIHDTVVLRGYAAYVDGVRLPRETAAARERVLPYGHRVAYPHGRGEELAMLSGRQAVALRVTSAAPAVLAIAPQLPWTPAERSVTRLGDAVIVAPLRPAAGPAPQYAALAADRPFELDDAADAPLVRTRGRTRALTVIAAFGATPEEAAASAVALVRGDAIGAERRARYARLTASMLRTSDPAYDRAVDWAKAAADLFVVEQFGKGIWAGLPWFRDNWGRDTFIALPGTLLVAGRYAEARAVLENFARYQRRDDPASPEYGRIPNRVAAGDSIIYNTVDGTPWMLREALDYVRYSGDLAFARRMHPLAKAYFDGALRHHTDAQGLLTHDDADTWMDARIEGRQAWSARGTRAVEIQALWYTALQAGAQLADAAGDADSAAQWRSHAARVREVFPRLYWDGAAMADRLRADGSRDLKVRPNQLMLVTIPFDDFIAPDVQAQVVRNAVSQLLYPHGIASLAATDPYFHPRHVDDARHHKDAAYHQGTIWGWNAGFTVTALTKFGRQDLAYRLARNLGAQITGLDTLGTMSELLDALPGPDGALRPSGTYAQSWSVAEYVRNAYQDFVGFRPDLLRGVLFFQPAPPWARMDAELPYGDGEHVTVHYARTKRGAHWRFKLSGAPRRIEMAFLAPDGGRLLAAFDAHPGVPAVLELDGATARLDGRPLAVRPYLATQRATVGALDFLPVRRYDPATAARDFPMLRGKDVLKGIVERGEYR